MTLAQALWLLAAALIVFWALGAYNRLVAMRNALGRAWEAVDTAIAQRAQALAPLVAALREALPQESAAIDALIAAQSASAMAADGVRSNPVRMEPLALFVQAEAVMTASSARVAALAEGAGGAAAAPLAAWRAVEPRLAYARQTFNERAAAYNDAVRLWPTRWLARWFGFGTAGRL